jgi:hypothetical protein
MAKVKKVNIAVTYAMTFRIMTSSIKIISRMTGRMKFKASQ